MLFYVCSDISERKKTNKDYKNYKGVDIYEAIESDGTDVFTHCCDGFF